MAVYLVTREGAPADEQPHIVQARTHASAVAHVGRTTLKAETIGLEAAMEYANRGIVLETAKA